MIYCSNVLGICGTLRFYELHDLLISIDFIILLIYFFRFGSPRVRSFDGRFPGGNQLTQSGAFPLSVTLQEWARKPKVKKSFFRAVPHRCFHSVLLNTVAPCQIFKVFMVFVSSSWRNTYMQDVTIWCLPNYLPIVTFFLTSNKSTEKTTVIERDFLFFSINCSHCETNLTLLLWSHSQNCCNHSLYFN